jgi:hypothetical protein
MLTLLHEIIPSSSKSIDYFEIKCYMYNVCGNSLVESSNSKKLRITYKLIKLSKDVIIQMNYALVNSHDIINPGS